MTLTYLSLFAGIGGLDLGLDRADWRCVGQVERDPYCRRVLARHWPEVPRHDDVRTAVAWWRSADRPAVRAVVGGFPCQPFSRAGRRRGVADERWGWPWFADVVRAIRPRYVLLENTSALLDDADAFGWVLGDLAEFGFDAQWSVLSACSVGAPHARERLFLVAHSDGVDGPQWVGARPGGAIPIEHGDAGAWPDPKHRPVEIATRGLRVADGPAIGLDAARVRATGNAVVPQVAEHIGRLIATADRTAATG